MNPQIGSDCTREHLKTPELPGALTLIRLGYFGGWKDWGGGGAYKAPPWDLGRGSRDHRKN